MNDLHYKLYLSSLLIDYLLNYKKKEHKPKLALLSEAGLKQRLSSYYKILNSRKVITKGNKKRIMKRVKKTYEYLNSLS